MKRITLGLIFGSLVAASSARAQVVNIGGDANPYLALNYPIASPTCSYAASPPGRCLSLATGVPLNYFATASQLTGLAARVDSQLTGFADRVDSQLTGFAARVDSQISRTLQLVAVAAAMKDAIPNPGDRFAIRLNAAGFEGQVAGAIGLGVNLDSTTRLHLNYGQGRSHGVVSGGINLSFR